LGLHGNDGKQNENEWVYGRNVLSRNFHCSLFICHLRNVDRSQKDGGVVL
jgi:hypothetical protein